MRHRIAVRNAIPFAAAVLLAACHHGERGSGPDEPEADAPAGERLDAGGDDARIDGASAIVDDAAPPPPPPPDAAPPPPPPPDAAAPPPPLPDAAPACSWQWQNLLVNGSFDAAVASWTELSSGGFPIITGTFPSGITPDTPPNLAWLGGYHDAIDEVWQTVTIPTGATSLRLKGYRWIASEDTSTVAHDVLYLRLRTPAGATIQTLATYSNTSPTSAFVAFEHAAASAHAGETLQLYLRMTTDATLNTNAFLDTLRLEAYVCL